MLVRNTSSGGTRRRLVLRCCPRPASAERWKLHGLEASAMGGRGRRSPLRSAVWAALGPPEGFLL